MKKKLFLITALFANVAIAEDIKRVDYEGGFTLWVDCDRRAAVEFRYNAQRDQGNFKRSHKFFIDDKLPASCNQLSTKSYKREKGEKPTYDRGHLVPANHLDHDENAIKQTNTMLNILPQVAQMNRGAWLKTEEITECYRDKEELLVIGGALFGDDRSKDFFKNSHGIETPNNFWKLIIKNDQAIAWIIPNSQKSNYKALDQYIVSPEELEKAGINLRQKIGDYKKYNFSKSNWELPKGCDKS